MRNTKKYEKKRVCLRRPATTISQISELGKGSSDWFLNGLEAASLAPTGMNRQNFFLEEKGDKVETKPLADNMMTRIDLGIVKYHFEVGSGKDKSIWK